MAKLGDHNGNPIDTGALLEEQAAPSMTGVRAVLSDHPSRGLTPGRLGAILLEAEEGDATRYLELAEDMEEKDLHYLAQLGTRKRAVAQLQRTVESASDSAEDVKAADLVRDYLRRDDLEDVLFDIMDAIGKGYSVCELLWDMSGKQWMPRDIVWRHPQWFNFSRTDGTTLMLREGAQLVPLTPYKYIVHTAKAKSGLPIRGGLARAAAWAWLFKNFTTKDWVSFAEVFGQPYRVGKYHPSATEADKAKLLRAVASIGSDAAAIIPQSMMVEFIESARSGSIDMYEKLCNFLDAQISKAVLGQTLTSDVSSAGGSRALGDVHNEVRRDIMRSDAGQLAATLNRCLVRPLVDLNLGPRANYPRIIIGLPDAMSTNDKIAALKTLVPFGMKVQASEVRDLIGFAEPAKDAEVLVSSGPAAAPSPQDQSLNARKVAHSATAAGTDMLDDVVSAALDDAGWREVMDPIVTPVEELLSNVSSLEELRSRLAELVGTMDMTQLRTLLERNATIAHLAGDLAITP